MCGNPLRVALDLSCALEEPLTGVGYVALHQARALLNLHAGLDIRLFATRARGTRLPADFQGRFSKRAVFSNARRIKLALWTHLNWPPIEWFCGKTEVAHGLFHLLPAATKARRLVTIHDLVVFRHPETHTASTVRQHRRMLTHAARHADALIAVSESCKQDAMEILKVPQEKVYVVPNGVSMQDFTTPLDGDALAQRRNALDLPDRYWVCLGTIEPRKNLCRLLHAYHRISERFPDCPDLLLAGRRGWLAKPVFETIAGLGLSNRVKEAGYLPRSDVILLLRGSAACLYPSLYEGFGLPVLEAMAARTPVMTSSVSAIPEVIGDCGILVDPTSVDALEEGLECLLMRPSESAKMAERAFARAQVFSWENSARRLLEVYRTVCTGHSASA